MERQWALPRRQAVRAAWDVGHGEASFQEFASQVEHAPAALEEHFGQQPFVNAPFRRPRWETQRDLLALDALARKRRGRLKPLTAALRRVDLQQADTLSCSH